MNQLLKYTNNIVHTVDYPFIIVISDFPLIYGYPMFVMRLTAKVRQFSNFEHKTYDFYMLDIFA